MVKILVTTSSFGKYDASPLEKLQQNGCHVILNPYSRKLNEAEIIELLIEHQPTALLAGVEPLNRTSLKTALPELKLISRCGIGMDSVDLEAAKEFGIIVTNTPDGPTIPVAELTMGMILSILRKIHISDAALRNGTWKRPMGNLLHGKTIGLIGCGRIGTTLAKMLSGFECRVLGADPAADRCDYYELIDLNTILSISDIISLHLPYNPQTHHFINKEILTKFKKGAVLINTARGGLVDEEALYMMLVNGHLSGAAIDTFENEPYQGPLINLENVLLTAHIGSYAQEARVMMEMKAVDNILTNLK